MLTEEMHMQVVVIAAAVTVTQLISRGARAILNGVQKMVLAEKRQGAENARLVNRQQLLLQLS